MKKAKNITRENIISGNDGLSFLGIFISCFLFLIVFFLISFFLLLITSLVLFNTESSLTILEYVAKVVLLFSSSLSGFLLSKKNKQRYLPCGATLGFFIVVLLMLLSIFLGQFDNLFSIWYLIIIFSTVLGSMLGIKRDSRKKTRRKH